jgi:hypothetical protein
MAERAAAERVMLHRFSAQSNKWTKKTALLTLEPRAFAEGALMQPLLKASVRLEGASDGLSLQAPSALPTPAIWWPKRGPSAWSASLPKHKTRRGRCTSTVRRMRLETGRRSHSARGDLVDVEAQACAGIWAAKYNAHGPPKPITFVDCYVLVRAARRVGTRSYVRRARARERAGASRAARQTALRLRTLHRGRVPQGTGGLRARRCTR